jgi:hypothetical protein
VDERRVGARWLGRCCKYYFDRPPK